MSDTQQKLAVVTGGAGFVGSHLCGRLVKGGWRVISLDNYFTGSKDNHVEGVEYREGHTKDISKVISETPDIIFHLGEYSRMEQSLLEPEVVHDLNVHGTEGVVDFWRDKKCKLLYAGSSTKFGDEGKTRGSTPYSITKAANSELVKRIGDAEGLPYAITYFYNVYGPGERAGVYGTVIESFRQMHMRGAPLTVTSPGTQVRNFTHVEDIVDGLMLVGEKGEGDEFGLGNEHSYSVLEVAQMFGDPIVMLPERSGNRMQSSLDRTKSNAIGWHPSRSLESYIKEFVDRYPRKPARESRVLVFSTTFFPVSGPAEEALLKLMQKMPDVEFDIVTTKFLSRIGEEIQFPQNVHVHRVGFGSVWDKYLLPLLGYRAARRLFTKHDYLFAWSIMASYAAFAGILLRRRSNLPLLITLADQNIESLGGLGKAALGVSLSSVDQVYGAGRQEEEIARLARGELPRRSMGAGDAFANQLRYSYAELLRQS